MNKCKCKTPDTMKADLLLKAAEIAELRKTIADQAKTIENQEDTLSGYRAAAEFFHDILHKYEEKICRMEGKLEAYREIWQDR